MEKVSWDDAQVFLTRLECPTIRKHTRRLGLCSSHRVAMGICACRAGTDTIYSWGNDIDATRANYSVSGLSQTRDVGYYAANPWGFFDMHGNVWEWTADWYHADYPTGNPLVDPTGPVSMGSGPAGWFLERHRDDPAFGCPRRPPGPPPQPPWLSCWFPTASNEEARGLGLRCGAIILPNRATKICTVCHREPLRPFCHREG